MSTKEEEIKIVFIAHGSYAEAMVAAAEALVGPLSITIVALDADASRVTIRRAIDDAAEQGPALLLTDLCGATPANICLDVAADRADREVVTGVNLPMLVRLSTADRSLGVAQLGKQLQVTTRRCVCLRDEMAPATLNTLNTETGEGIGG